MAFLQFNIGRHELPSRWKCSWCDYINIRQNAGLDHCSACGAETMTIMEQPGILLVRYSLAPPARTYRLQA